MNKKSTSISSGNVAVDPSKMSYSDLVEGAYMLQAAGTLLRQAFGIVSLTNSLQENPLSDSELKSFASCFDTVHKIVNTIGKALFDYASKHNK